MVMVLRNVRLGRLWRLLHQRPTLSTWIVFTYGFSWVSYGGKSAILTALCVAFGIKARGTQRATSLKDFIKNGCSHALVVVEMTNQGVDAFKFDDYGGKIVIERRITESGNTTVLKDSHGKKVSNRKEDLQELVDHFNIDVENPCVIMTQDKSREFLHSGTGKDKFKFFYRATLLQQVFDLLKGIQQNIDAAGGYVDEMEQEMRPVLEQLKQLHEKMKSVESMEQMGQNLVTLRKLAAWSEANEEERRYQEGLQKLEKYSARKPACEEKINKIQDSLKSLREDQTSKKAAISSLLQKTREFRQMQDEKQKRLTQATREDAQIEEEQSARKRSIEQMVKRLQWLEQQIYDIRNRHMQASQAEEKRQKEDYFRLQSVIDESSNQLRRLEEEMATIDSRSTSASEEVNQVREEIEEKKRESRELNAQIQKLQSQQSNKVTAFGGENVLRLLRTIEQRCREFSKPPLGPLGAHVGLIGDDSWALALEIAIGKLLNAFIVTNHRDMLVLRDCAKTCGYHNLQIIIYDFNRPLLNIPSHMLPDKALMTIQSLLSIDSATVMNVLIDQGSVERQVLVKDYHEGKHVVFERRAAHVKEVYTLDGTRMFTRGNTQTTLPPDSRIRSGRLCAAVDDVIRNIENDMSALQEDIQRRERHKRAAELSLHNLRDELQSFKRRKRDLQMHISRQQLQLRDLRNAVDAETNLGADPNVDELEEEIARLNSDRQSKEDSLEKLKIKRSQSQEKVSSIRSEIDLLHESAKDDIEAFQARENELIAVEEEIAKGVAAESHYKSIMQEKVMQDIRNQEAENERQRRILQETIAKASEICSREELESLHVPRRSSEQLRTEMRHLKETLQREEGRHEESADEIRSKFNKMQRRVEKKKAQYSSYRQKLAMVEEALGARLKKFQRNSSYLKRQLTWQFNGHLQKKGMSGKIQVDFSDETLGIQVQMPQDASNNMVKDTRGLSGGERSFSTLCFALALQEMTEAPFRAMDEFDVFMDAVSRKISLETVVDFAVSHGSQWIFITPHDISMVKAGERVKKQQLAAPRP
ncbi:hypothetical protein GOP47_0024706 [Adiantum capillus-veneris]|uniref:RecF/RecN/SMC N-terminal domain-containing protein n=1 Tax=Adiantum capillus-veneris TaxID=13818 RepID=A0A9D4U4X6_ADICA|nr:hypothetical protein GOP47_0024706 [Adiantum capillus-veneris]